MSSSASTPEKTTSARLTPTQRLKEAQATVDEVEAYVKQCAWRAEKIYTRLASLPPEDAHLAAFLEGQASAAKSMARLITGIIHPPEVTDRLITIPEDIKKKTRKPRRRTSHG